jgi:hypothetical protein
MDSDFEERPDQQGGMSSGDGGKIVIPKGAKEIGKKEGKMTSEGDEGKKTSKMEGKKPMPKGAKKEGKGKGVKPEMGSKGEGGGKKEGKGQCKHGPKPRAAKAKAKPKAKPKAAKASDMKPKRAMKVSKNAMPETTKEAAKKSCKDAMPGTTKKVAEKGSKHKPGGQATADKDKSMDKKGHKGGKHKTGGKATADEDKSMDKRNESQKGNKRGIEEEHSLPSAMKKSKTQSDEHNRVLHSVVGSASWASLPIGGLLRLGVDCAGMLPEALALDDDKVPYKIIFASEKDFDKVLLMRHLHGSDFKLYDSVEGRNNKKAEPVDALLGGFPCQPFSDVGAHGGFCDRKIEAL